MPYTMKLPYTRFVRQVSGENVTLTGWKIDMISVFEQLKSAPWIQSRAYPSDITMPINTPLSFTPSSEYDTFKMGSTVAASGKQVCHMGMVAYRFTMPAEANTNNKRITSISFNLGADKFNVKGLKACVYFSDTATPPTDWTTCRTGVAATEDIVTGGVTHGVLPSLEATLSLSQNKSGNYTLAVTQAVDYAYIYLILSNWDYTDYRTSREYYIEGSGILDGRTTEFTFDAVSVTADAPISGGVPAQTTSWTLGATISSDPAIWEMYGVFPGGSVANPIDPIVAFTNVTATTGGGASTIAGTILDALIKPGGTPYKRMTIAGLNVDLTSKDFSILCNVWVGIPGTNATSSKWDNFVSWPTTNTPATMSTLFFAKSGSVAPIVNIGSAPVTLSLVHAGQFIMERGKAYTATSTFPINIAKEQGVSLQVMITLAPYDLGTPSTTTTVQLPLDPMIYLS